MSRGPLPFLLNIIDSSTFKHQKVCVKTRDDVEKVKTFQILVGACNQDYDRFGEKARVSFVEICWSLMYFVC